MMDLTLYAGIGAVALVVVILLASIPEIIRDLRRWGVPGVVSGLKSLLKDLAYITGFIGAVYALLAAVGYVVYTLAVLLLELL